MRGRSASPICTTGDGSASSTLHTRVAARCLRDECCAGGCEVLYDRRVECFPCAVSQRVDDIANPETEQFRGLCRHACDAGGSSDLLAAQRTSARAVPPLMNVVQTVADAVRQPDATRDAPRNFATRLIVSLAERTARHCHAHSPSHARGGRKAACRPWNQRGRSMSEWLKEHAWKAELSLTRVAARRSCTERYLVRAPQIPPSKPLKNQTLLQSLAGTRFDPR